MNRQGQQIHCIVIDDEPLARKGLREYIADIDFLHLSGEFENPVRALELLGTGEVDLLFLDIQMPKLTGLDLLRSLPNKPLTILTTAYSEHALEAFDLDVLDYLVKPITPDRFLKAVLKARDLWEWKNQEGQGEKEATPDHFFIKADNRLVRLLYKDILFVEALQNYVVVHTTDKKYMTYITFKAIEEHLPADLFLKVHKSYIVALDKVTSIEGTDIRMGPHQIPISRSLREFVMEKILGGHFPRR